MQAEGGYDHLILNIQPEGRYKSLILRHQLEGCCNPLSFPHPSTMKYRWRPTITTKIISTVTVTIIVTSNVTVTTISTSSHLTYHCHINMSNLSLSHQQNKIHSHPHANHAKIHNIISQTICST